MGNWGGFRINGKDVGSCCRECNDKFPACHDVCEKFQKAQAEWEQKKKQIEDAKRASKAYDDYHYRSIGKCRRARFMKGKGY